MSMNNMKMKCVNLCGEHCKTQLRDIKELEKCRHKMFLKGMRIYVKMSGFFSKLTYSINAIKSPTGYFSLEN